MYYYEIKYNVETDKYNNKRYYKEGTKILHREDGPAMEYADGTKEWWVNGKLHRTNGPAIEYSTGHKVWYQYGKRHRLDGPAMKYADGGKFYYIYGNQYFEKEYNSIIKLYKTYPLNVAIKMIEILKK